MKKILLVSLLSVFSICFTSIARIKKCSLSITDLHCEYLINPAGLDELHPRLSWIFKPTDSLAHKQRQTAYQIIVSTDSNVFKTTKNIVWNSGWVDSDEMQLIEYNGKSLLSDKTYFWKVHVKDEEGQISSWSKTAYWTTGLLHPNDWKASWIGTDQIFNPKYHDCNISDPWLRKTFSLSAKPGKATLFIASIGYHEVYVNGKKISNDVLSPAVTNHIKRARYITYNIADQLHTGKNVIAIWLGTSWSIFGPYITKQTPGTPMVIAQTSIYKNIKAHTKPLKLITTDQSWLTHESPEKLLGSWDGNNMGGELWDANKEIKDWNLPSCNDSGWKKATIYTPKIALSAQQVETNHLLDTIKPIDIISQKDDSYKVDMGVNFTGWTSICVNGQPGDRIDFFFSEKAQQSMTFGIHSAFIIGKSGKGVFQNRFNYSTGRWITIRGLTHKPKLSDIKGWLVRTNYQSATTFECADELQNWVFKTVNWTFQNLSLGGYVVDCPHRERLGYGGDANATCETGIFNYSLGAFYTKWMEDWRDVQGTPPSAGKVIDSNQNDKGILPYTAPTYMGGGGPAWAGITVSLPWYIYQHEGDKRILTKNFELIKGWLDFLDRHTQDNMLVRFGGEWDFLGDWLWPGASEEGMMTYDKPATLFFNNCYRIYSLRTAAKIARVIGKISKAEKWEKEATISSISIHRKFYNENDNSYADSSMSNLAVSLLADIMPPMQRKNVMQRLEKEILVIKKGHIHSGITGGALLFKLLREEGRDDLIYAMTSQNDYPGWGFMKANGATTIWEAWEKNGSNQTLLHSSYLYPGAWYIEGLAGIKQDKPGFRRFIVRPPMLTGSQMPWAKVQLNSPAGLIKSAWKRENDLLSLQVTIPPNCTARLEIPKEESKSVTGDIKYIQHSNNKDNYHIYDLPAGIYSLNFSK